MSNKKKITKKTSNYNNGISNFRHEFEYETPAKKQRIQASINAQVQEFIKNGGKIQKVDTHPKPSDYRFMLRARSFSQRPTIIH